MTISRWPMHSHAQPMTPLSLAILMAVADSPQHGYAIMKQLEQRPGARLVAGAGSLYAALDRMAEEGLLGAREDYEDARRRRVFHLTRRGRQAAQEELARMSHLLAE